MTKKHKHHSTKTKGYNPIEDNIEDNLDEIFSSILKEGEFEALVNKKFEEIKNELDNFKGSNGNYPAPFYVNIKSWSNFKDTNLDYGSAKGLDKGLKKIKVPHFQASTTQILPPKAPCVTNYINKGNINIIGQINAGASAKGDLGEVIENQAPNQPVYCSNCGADLSDLSSSSQFCPYCGYHFRRKRY